MKFSDARGGSYGAKKALRCVNWTAASETSRKRHWRVLDQPGQGLGHRESPLKAPSSHLGAGTVCQRGEQGEGGCFGIMRTARHGWYVQKANPAGGERKRGTGQVGSS